MAVTVTYSVQDYNNLVNIRKQLRNPDDQATLQAYIRTQFIVPVQTAAVAADGAAQMLLAGIGRQWIKNTSGADITIEYNRYSYVFSNGSIYCVDLDEAQFFRERSNGGLVSDTEANWVGAGGVVQAFVW